MGTLTVYREWNSSYNQTTILRDENNKVKAIITSSIKQPKMNQKIVVINRKEFLLNWELVAGKQIKQKENEHSKRSDSAKQQDYSKVYGCKRR